MSDFDAIIAAAETGDFKPMNDARAPDARTQSAFSSMKLLAGIQRKFDLDAVVQSASPGDAVGAIAVEAASRYAWLSFDVRALGQLRPLLLGMRPSASSRAGLRVALERHRIDWALEGGGDAAELEALEQRAVANGVASVAVEAAALRAAVQLEVGDFEEALRNARRASRMGRTESLPQSEYWSNLILARVRRITGKPYLGTVILSQLAAIAPPAWQLWMAWERVMCGGANAVNLESIKDDAPPAQLVRWLRMKAQAPDVRDWRVLDRDVERVGYLIDLGHDPRAASFIAWRTGESPHSPPEGGAGLIPLRVATSEESRWEAFTACIIRVPGQSGQRLLTSGMARIAGPRVKTIAPSVRKKGKQDVLLAILALAGAEGIPEAELFRRVYGFKFSASLHAATFNVLLHRAREQLGDLAELVRQDGNITIRCDATLVVADPRCAPAMEHRVLHLLSTGRTTTAKETAETLGIPLRSVQTILETLTAEGAAQRVRRGNRVSYQIDDTTFRPPTRV